MNKNVYGDFQIYISVPLTQKDNFLAPRFRSKLNAEKLNLQKIHFFEKKKDTNKMYYIRKNCSEHVQNRFRFSKLLIGTLKFLIVGR